MASFTVTEKTFSAKSHEVEPNWYVVDADNRIVGRFASKLAIILMGKHKPIYTPHVDCGDYVIVQNCSRVRFTGQPLAHESHPYFTRKMARKEYQRYSGYPSGLKTTKGEVLIESKPGFVLREAVRRMLPKNKLGRQMLKKLKLYTGEEHPHQSQNPLELPEEWL